MLKVLTLFYSDVQQSILNPVSVASLLRQEGIASKDLLDEVSAKATQSEKTASIMRHVEAAVRSDAKSFWKFVTVLEQSPPSCTVASKMKEAMKLQEKSENLYTLYACTTSSCDGALCAYYFPGAQKKDDSPLTPTGMSNN